AIGFYQVEVQLGTEIAVAGRSLRHEKQGIALANLLGLEHFLKKLARIGKLGFKLVSQFVTDFVAAGVNTSAHGCSQITGVAAEAVPHLAHSLLHDACQRSAPAGVKRAYRFTNRVCDQHRHAVSSSNSQHQAGSSGK